jgi:hypothetical protein
MDHRYIDNFSVAERYLAHTLAPEEQRIFETHVVACQECADRLLLAQMWLEKKELEGKRSTSLPRRARFVAQFQPWQLLVFFVVAALLLLAVPTAYFWWELARLTARR